MLITKQLLLKLDMLSLKYWSNFTKFFSNFFNFEQLLSNFLAYFLATILAFSEQNLERPTRDFEKFPDEEIRVPK